MGVKVVVPQIGQSIAEVTIVKWFKKPGDSIEKGEPLVEIGTDKINMDIPSPESGIIETILVAEGETVSVETEIAVIGSSVGFQPAERESVTEPGGQDARATTRTSPFVRKLASEHGIDLQQIQGTGEGGRVTKEDVLKLV